MERADNQYLVWSVLFALSRHTCRNVLRAEEYRAGMSTLSAERLAGRMLV